MNVFDRDRKRAALTITELLVVIATLCVLLLLGAATIIQGHKKWQRVACINSLKNLGLGFRIYERDTSGTSKLPFQSAKSPQLTTYDEFLSRIRLMSNEISSPFVLVCTADSRRPARDWPTLSRTNISYFISLDAAAETYPQSFLAGDRNITTNGVRMGPGIVKLDCSTTNVAWDRTIHRFQGNAVMGDGSVQQLSSARLKDQITNTGLNSMTLAVP